MQLPKLAAKNAFRHKLRTCLTILGVAIAILAFGMLRTVINAWYSGVEAASATRLVARNAISIMFSLPLSYKEKIRQVEGVTEVSYGNWFGGIYIDEKNFFANFAMEPKSYLALYPEYIVPPEEQAAFLRDRNSFMAGRKLAARFGWKIGDIVTLRGTIFPGNWEFVLRAIYRGREPSTDETLFIFHWDALNETLKATMPDLANQVGFYMVGVKRPDHAAQSAAAIDALFKNSLAETLTETEKAFNLSFVAMSDAIITAIRVVSYVVIVIILAVVANTMVMSCRERTGEYAILKTLGFGAWRVAGLIFGESLVITMLGCVTGIVLTFPVTRVFADAMAQFFPIFTVSSETLFLEASLSFLVGVCAAVVPTYQAIRTPIADGLRSIG